MHARLPLLCRTVLLLAATPVFLRGASAVLFPTPASAVNPAVPLAVQPFDLASVRLGPGPFLEAQQRDAAYLLRLQSDRLLHTFRLNVGLPSTALPYGGWESPTVELRGHTMGHYLSACALMYRSTGDAGLKRRIDYLVTELARCQAASPKAGFNPGYLSAFPESFIDRVEARKEVWAPYYTLHKIFAGLIDAYELAGSTQALEVAKAMGNWVAFRVDRLTPAQMQASLETEHGGMTESLANLYAITGDKTYLRLAHAFDHAAVIDPLAEGKDKLDGLHANTQIPKIIGAAREFELTGDARYRKIAETFWDRVALHRSYVIGGHSDREHFFPVTDFAHHLSAETAETCNTYNMLKLTEHLYDWDGQARWMDFYERGLYNHILASQDPARGMFVYLMALESGDFKTYSTPENSFWCCVGTGMENHAKYAEAIYAHDADVLFVNLFISSELSWPQKQISLRQETRFPEEDRTRLIISSAAPVELALRIRHPQWSAGALELRVNGTAIAAAPESSGYAEVRRTWKNGDVLEVGFKLALHTEALPGDEKQQAILYGPIVLAGRLGSEDMPSPYARDQLDLARFPHPAAPVIVSGAGDWVSQIRRVSADALVFHTNELTKPNDVVLEPFYRVHHERHAVYWEVLTPEGWADRKSRAEAAAAEWKMAQASAVDLVTVGDSNSEAQHRIQSTTTTAGVVAGRSWRQAQKGASFTYTLATKGGVDLALLCAYGARDHARRFSVLVDGTKVAGPKLDGDAPGELFVDRYVIPRELVQGKETVNVTFQADPEWNAATATVFACALVPNN